jgi:3-oxoacyl-[acyl-carrier protein] reductase
VARWDQAACSSPQNAWVEADRAAVEDFAALVARGLSPQEAADAMNAADERRRRGEANAVASSGSRLRRDWAEREVPVGYIGQPEDLGVLVAFLCSPRARYITGQVIHVDGGTRRFSH